ncbi:MAG: hypothetical protein E6I50_08655 [Chloroflexi bacterium]|nr:MAG: hypothetical protein E6I50_08655 [Chloroflexota bacterium]
MASLTASPALTSSQPSIRYMSPHSLMKSWRRSCASSTLRLKPAGSMACQVLAASQESSLIDRRRAFSTHSSSSMEPPASPTRSWRWQTTEVAWKPTSPVLSIPASRGSFSSCLPTQSRSAAEALDIWHSEATQEQALLPTRRWAPRTEAR